MVTWILLMIMILVSAVSANSNLSHNGLLFLVSPAVHLLEGVNLSLCLENGSSPLVWGYVQRPPPCGDR